MAIVLVETKTKTKTKTTEAQKCCQTVPITGINFNKTDSEKEEEV